MVDIPADTAHALSMTNRTRHNCRHLTQSWDDRDFLRCFDCGVKIGRAYNEVGDPSDSLFVIFDARYCGGDLAPGVYAFV